MKVWIHRIASMKVAVVLLILVVIAMAGATIVESTKGSAVAMSTVYGTAWFRLLLAAFAVNVLASLIDKLPWGRARIGYAITHGSMLVILAGALVTYIFKIEGRLPILEGEEGSRFIVEQARGGGMGSVMSGAAAGSEEPGELGSGTLPFSVRLDSFEIDYYQGTMRPAMFRSRVTVKDPAHGREFPAVIEMNKELSYGGFKLFQSSYKRTQDRDMTILSVSRDPGQPIVFAGYILLIAGMITVIGIRMSQGRALPPTPPPAGSSPGLRVLSALGLFAVLAWGAPARAATIPNAATADALRSLPVQHDGRVMPLDTLAREASFNVTGRIRWQGTDPVAMVLGWSFDPAGWAAERIIPVGRDVADAAGLPPGTRRASFNDLVRNRRLLDLLREADEAEQGERPLSPLQSHLQRLGARLNWMQSFLDRSAIKAIPARPDPHAEWSAPQNIGSAADLASLARQAPASGLFRSGMMEKEILYNRVRPSRLAWWILLGATVVSLVAWIAGRRWLDGLSLAGLIAGFAAMTWGIAIRWQVAGRIPASDMYESLLFLGWGVCLFALIAFLALRNRLVIFNATAISALTMVLADSLPIDPFIHPMPPVLSGTPWLAIHVPIIMTSYSVLALGVLIAHLQIGLSIFAPSRRDLALKMFDFLYWYILVGSTLLIAGIITGSIWAASSWGRYWGWDPKEVWSLVAFLAYLTLLHARLDRLIGIFGVAALSIVAFWTILMTYIGVNYILASGLHSYGFGGSGVVTWLLIVAAAETLFLIAGLFAQALAGRKQQSLPIAP